MRDRCLSRETGAACRWASVRSLLRALPAAGIAIALSLRADATTVCSGAATLEGIDVSAYDGAIDWTLVAATKAFAFARVSDGTGAVDPTFAGNYAGIRAAGMARGAYQTFEPAQDAVAQAQLLLQQIPVPQEHGDLPPALDVELTGGQTPAAIASAVQAWVTTVQAATGKAPLIFTGRFFWDDDVQSTALSGYPLWTMQWSGSCPTLPAAWNGWLIWQHSDSGIVSGVSGAVDLDTFNGSAQQLQALTQEDRVFLDGFESR